MCSLLRYCCASVGEVESCWSDCIQSTHLVCSLMHLRRNPAADQLELCSSSPIAWPGSCGNAQSPALACTDNSILLVRSPSPLDLQFVRRRMFSLAIALCYLVLIVAVWSSELHCAYLTKQTASSDVASHEEFRSCARIWRRGVHNAPARVAYT
jgi:hypothetical protein